MLLHRTSAATRPLRGSDNKIAQENVTVVIFFLLKLVYLSRPTLYVARQY